MGEWDTFNDILLLDTKSSEALVYLIWWSLRRADSTVTKAEVEKLLVDHPEVATLLVDKICALSLPVVDKPPPKRSVSESERKRNLKSTYRILSRLHNWTPPQISQMSPAQVCSYLLGGKTGTGLEKMTSEEYKQLLAAKGKL